MIGVAPEFPAKGLASKVLRVRFELTRPSSHFLHSLVIWIAINVVVQHQLVHICMTKTNPRLFCSPHDQLSTDVEARIY